MDEYTPYQDDLTEMKYLCNILHNQCMDVLNENHRYWVDAPTMQAHLQLDELIEYLISFELTFRIKYPQRVELINILNEYLGQTHNLFSRYDIDEYHFKKWLNAKSDFLDTLLTRD